MESETPTCEPHGEWRIMYGSFVPTQNLFTYLSENLLFGFASDDQSVTEIGIFVTL